MSPYRKSWYICKLWVLQSFEKSRSKFFQRTIQQRWKKHSLPQKEIFFYLIKKITKGHKREGKKNFHVMTS